MCIDVTLTEAILNLSKISEGEYAYVSLECINYLNRGKNVGSGVLCD